MKGREIFNWGLVVMVLVVLSLGWYFPIVGFFVPLVMLIGFIFGSFRGRFICGNFCPRGKFFEKIITPISPKKTFPKFLRTKIFRFSVFVLLIGFMLFRLSQDLGNWEHWGRVFWLMCLITTSLGVILAIIFTPRSWCMICPVGTFGAHMSGGKYNPEVDKAACLGCKMCEKKCPMQLGVTGEEKHLDCLQCKKCENICPKKCVKIGRK